jgi:UDP-N-acetyl-D-galactosamine dehydrogenase
LQQFGIQVDVYDPHANKVEVELEYGITLIESINSKYDSIILAVSHVEFLSFDIKTFRVSDKTVIFDVKSFLDRNIVTSRL